MMMNLFINFAIDSDLLILTNDLYRDIIEKRPDLRVQIEGPVGKIHV